MAAPLVDLPAIFAEAQRAGDNPFVAVRQALSHALAPHTSRAFAVQLRVLLAVALAILLVQLVTIGVKYRRGSPTLLMVRSTRIGSFVTPTSTAWMVMNLLFLIPLLLALIFSYAVYQDRRLVFLPAMAWTSVTCFVPLWMAGWMATWSLAVAAVAPSDDVTSARLVRSRWAAHIVNALGFLIPLSLVVTVIPLYAVAQRHVSQAGAAFESLEAALNTAAATSAFTPTALLPLLPQALALQAAVLEYIRWVRFGDAAWLAWVLLLLAALCAFSYLQVRRTNRSIGQISSRHDDEFVLDLRTFCAAELPEGAMRPAPTGQVNLKTLVRRLRVVVSQTLIMAFTALAFFVVLAWKTVNETRSLTDRIALETIRLLLFWAYALPVGVVSVLMLWSTLSEPQPSAQRIISPVVSPVASPIKRRAPPYLSPGSPRSPMTEKGLWLDGDVFASPITRPSSAHFTAL